MVKKSRRARRYNRIHQYDGLVDYLETIPWELFSHYITKFLFNIEGSYRGNVNDLRSLKLTCKRFNQKITIPEGDWKETDWQLENSGIEYYSYQLERAIEKSMPRVHGLDTRDYKYRVVNSIGYSYDSMISRIFCHVKSRRDEPEGFKRGGRGGQDNTEYYIYLEFSHDCPDDNWSTSEETEETSDDDECFGYVHRHCDVHHWYQTSTSLKELVDLSYHRKGFEN